MKLIIRTIQYLAIVLFSLFVLSEIFSKTSAKVILSSVNHSAGLQKDNIKTSFGTVNYLYGGEGDTVVFLHGIFAQKEHWVEMSRYVSADFKVILLDLPGFGENHRLEMSQYEFDRQTANITETLTAMGLSKFHLVANSMGAQIAAQIAVSSPDRVQSLSFIGSPVGILSPIKSDMDIAISKNDFPLVVETKSDYKERMFWLFEEQPFLPRPIIRTWRAKELAHAELNPLIWEAVHDPKTVWLEEIAPELKLPSLIIWCRKDRIFHISGAKILNDALPNSTLVEPENCGHLPMLERPKKIGMDLRVFLIENKGN